MYMRILVSLSLQMKVAMRNNETWTLWSHVILLLLLVVDARVHAQSSYDGDVKGCISNSIKFCLPIHDKVRINLTIPSLLWQYSRSQYNSLRVICPLNLASVKSPEFGRVFRPQPPLCCNFYSNHSNISEIWNKNLLSADALSCMSLSPPS